MEIVSSVTQENDGGYAAEGLSHDIFTQGDTWEALRANVREAVSAYFFDQTKPATIRLHLGGTGGRWRCTGLVSFTSWTDFNIQEGGGLAGAYRKLTDSL